jgi:hypothetical protein
LRVIQLGELEATNLGSNHRSELRHFEIGVVVGQQGRLGLVRCKTPIRKLEWLDWVKVSLLVVDGKIVMIFVLERNGSEGAIIEDQCFG